MTKLNLFDSNVHSRAHKRQRTILFQGEIPKAVYFIKSGIVRVYNILDNGEERTIEFLAEGDVLAANWVFGNSKATLYYYDAFTDVSLIQISKEELNQSMKDPVFSKQVVQSLTKRYIASTMHANALLQTYAGSKIAQGLQFLVLSNGNKLPNGKYTINIRLTQQDLANLVGVTRETAALELAKIKRKKIISYSSFTYTIDYDALVRLGGGDEFTGLSI